MRKKIIYNLIVLLVSLSFTGNVFAVDMDHSSHGDNDKKTDKPFHESMIDGYHFKYKLIDMREKLKKLKSAENVAATHHLMVYITMNHGDYVMTVDKAKVGYLLITPDGKKAPSMAMGMGSGFGADINLNKKGEYTIKTKVVTGGKKLVDSFKYTAK